MNCFKCNLFSALLVENSRCSRGWSLLIKGWNWKFKVICYVLTKLLAVRFLFRSAIISQSIYVSSNRVIISDVSWTKSGSSSSVPILEYNDRIRYLFTIWLIWFISFVITPSFRDLTAKYFADSKKLLFLTLSIGRSFLLN